MKRATPSLVVCPTSVALQLGERDRALPPDPARRRLPRRRARSFDAAADVTLTTYAILRLDAERARRRAAWDAVVLDEAQAIKNPDSQTARAAYALRAGFRLALTGTPVENRLDELWSLMHFANRGLLGGRARFRTSARPPDRRGAPGRGARLCASASGRSCCGA